MPLSIPGTGVLLTRDNFATAVKSFVDNLESSLETVTTTANSALTKANSAYVKDALGIAVGELTAAVQTVVNGALVVSTSTTRPAVTNAVLFSTATDPGTNATAGKDFWIGDIAP